MAFRKRTKNFSRSSNNNLYRDNNRNRDGNRHKQEKDEFLAKISKEPENPLEPATLESLPESIQQAYQRAGWDTIMPVQAHAIPYLLEGRHMMIQSRTGSGKTGGYILPLLEKISLNVRQPQALVLVPTRELAIQVEKEAKKLLGETVHTITLYGGVPYPKQLDALRKGVQLVIGTPGRVLDHLQKGTLSLEALKALIFDEADRMLSIGFYPDMKAIQEHLPENEELLVTLFSATYPQNVLKLAKQFLKDPQLLSLSQGQVHIAEMQHYCVLCKRSEKERNLLRILEIENPSSGIIFCNTKATVHYLTQVIKGFGYNAEEISSELSQARREHVLMRLRKGDTRFLVATDVAARGIDVPNLSHVFLYEPPEDKESYIHKAGRTGRAGATGTVISLVDNMERLELEKIAKFYSIELTPYSAPSESDVAKVVSEKVIALLEQQKRTLNGLENERIERYLTLVEELVNQENASDKENFFLFAMLLDQVYQKALNPAPIYHNEPRNNRRDRNRSSYELKDKTLTNADTLDSMRANFQSEMKEKYGHRRDHKRDGQRRDRNAPWRHEKQDFNSEREAGRNNYSERKSFHSQNRERSYTKKEGFSNDGFKERSYNDNFSHKNKRSYSQHENDNDVFFGANKSHSRYEGKEQNATFSHHERNGNQPYRRSNERNGEYTPKKSFLPQRGRGNSEENFKVFHDDSFMTPVKSKKRFFERDLDSTQQHSFYSENNANNSKGHRKRNKK